MNDEKLKIIDILIASCMEGYTGDWDCSNGKESFLDMIILLEELKA